MSLSPLTEASQNPQGDAGTDGQSTFRQRKMQSLQGESEPAPGKAEDLTESVEDGYPEEDQFDDEPVQDDEETAEIEVDDDQEESDATLDDPGEDDDLEGEDEDPASLKQKLLAAQRKITEITQNRKKIEKDLSDGIAANLGLRHQLEDEVRSNQQRGLFWLNMAQQQVKRFENLDWSQVPPDQANNLRAQHQQAVNQQAQIANMFQQMDQAAKEALETQKSREAEISRNVLSRRIENWSNEHYGQLREHATTLGYSPQEFGEITDWRVMMLIHNSWEQNQAVEKVQGVKRKQKTRPPRNRNRRPQQRNAQGRYRNARDDAFANPGDKGKMRTMFEKKLAKERTSR